MRVLALIAVLAVSACTPVGPSGSVADGEPAGPTLASGSLSREGESTARALLEEARAAAETGRLAEALAAAGRVVEEYPSSRVSVEALWLRSRLRAEGGLGRVERGADPSADDALAQRLAEARNDLDRLLGVIPPDDPRGTAARLLAARVRVAEGDYAAAVRQALSLPADADSASVAEAVPWVREAAVRVPGDELATLLSAADPGKPLRVPVLVAYARSLRLSGDEDGARRYAQSALDAGAEGTDVETARALLEGRGLPRADDAPVPMGIVLPLGGSPAFQVFSRQLREGIETAVHGWGLEGEVELIFLDDGGDVPTAANLVRAAETRGAVAVLGLLDDASLAAAADVRVDIPLVSPTAYDLPPGVQPVLSLNAFDPGAAEKLAQWAADSGIRQVAIIHASRGSSADEARVFTETFESLGGSVLRSFPYEPGVTFWEAQILGAAALEPEALVLPVPAEDLPGMAPQVTFFGLDTLGIRVLGTGGWTEPQVLEEVDPRHTEGVVAATPVRPGEDSPGYQRFREAYETRFRRSLVDGSVRALGFDAASLILQGVYAGAGSPDEVVVALEQVQGLEGATGILSVVDGRVLRRHHVVCVEAGEPREILSGQLPVQQYRAYEPDPETGAVPEGPGRPDGFTCPLPTDSVAPGDTLAPGDSLLPPDTFDLSEAPLSGARPRS